MKSLNCLLVCCALFTPAYGTAAEAPFAPLPNVPDYVATFAAQGRNALQQSKQVVTHHAGWTRVDSGAEKPHQSTTYANSSVPLLITVWASFAGGMRLDISRGRDNRQDWGWNKHSYRTGATDTVLGESCDIWVVSSSSIDGAGYSRHDLKRLSCITRDGIELRNWFENDGKVTSGREAIELRRKPVNADHVGLPEHLLDFKWWIAWEVKLAENSPTDAGQTVVIMESSNTHSKSAKPTRVTRRYGGWEHQENIDGQGYHSLSWAYDHLKLSFRLERGSTDNKFERMIVQKFPIDFKDSFRKGVALAPARQDNILGEQCTWFDMSPGMMDASHTECRTEDGLVLKEIRSARGFYRELIATRIERKPLTLADVQPPPEILTLKYWGIAE